MREGKADFGYNARTEEYANMYKAGIIDPTKVTRIALENAASIASLLLTTECVITDEPEEEGAAMVIISAEIEAEISTLEADEAAEFMTDLGITEPGLDRMISVGYGLLGLQTYFTVGPKEARAWTIKEGTKAPKAAAVIHTDFEKGFIRAECMAYDDFIEFNGEQGCKEAGKHRVEGKEYIVKDGDILHFRFNV